MVALSVSLGTQWEASKTVSTTVSAYQGGHTYLLPWELLLDPHSLIPVCLPKEYSLEPGLYKILILVSCQYNYYKYLSIVF